MGSRRLNKELLAIGVQSFLEKYDAMSEHIAFFYRHQC